MKYAIYVVALFTVASDSLHRGESVSHCVVANQRCNDTNSNSQDAKIQQLMQGHAFCGLLETQCNAAWVQALLFRQPLLYQSIVAD